MIRHEIDDRLVKLKSLMDEPVRTGESATTFCKPARTASRPRRYKPVRAGESAAGANNKSIACADVAGVATCAG